MSNQTMERREPIAQRPGIAIGHVSLRVSDVPEAVTFFVKLGIRSVAEKADFAVLELRGGTHLVLRPSDEPVVARTRITFDVMVDDIEVAHREYAQGGLDVHTIKRGRIHDSFDVRTLRGDINRDGVVSTADASIIKPRFGQLPGVVGAEFDYNVDGIVSTADFSQVKPLFGNATPVCP